MQKYSWKNLQYLVVLICCLMIVSQPAIAGKLDDFEKDSTTRKKESKKDTKQKEKTQAAPLFSLNTADLVPDRDIF